jgi:hypothetical protein
MTVRGSTKCSLLQLVEEPTCSSLFTGSRSVRSESLDATWLVAFSGGVGAVLTGSSRQIQTNEQGIQGAGCSGIKFMDHLIMSVYDVLA